MTAAAAIFLLGFAGALMQSLRLALRWRVGRPAGVDLFGGLLRLPAAYLGAVHRVVARERRVARMHVLVAGGTVFAALFVVAGALTGWSGLGWLAIAAALAGCVGALIDARRRRPRRRPARLSRGSYDDLPYALGVLDLSVIGLVSIDLAAPAAPAPLMLFVAALGLIAMTWLVWNAGGGPMRHALAGVVHLIAHPRPERFTAPDRVHSALRPLDLDADRLGAGSIGDFGWNDLASFDACVECGKCESACPAYAAGQPLNPKALIHDLVTAQGGTIGAGYTGHGHPGRAVDRRRRTAGEPLVVAAAAAAATTAQEKAAADGKTDPMTAGTASAGDEATAESPIAAETLWSCTTCRACVDACPMLIEHVDAIVAMRRHETLEKGAVPRNLAKALTALRETDTQCGRANAGRFDWAADLSLPVLSNKGACELLFFAGEAAFELRNQKTMRAFLGLLKQAGVDVAILGEEERDCGDLSRRLGEETGFQALARQNIATLSKYRFERIVTTDPHVLHCLSREYPAFGGVFEVAHHTRVLEELAAAGRLRIDPGAAADLLPPGAVTYHDPCYLGRYMGETEAPRSLLGRLGIAVAEMEHHGRLSRCCGAGGGAALADIPGKRRVADVRVDEARAVAAGTIVASCPFCTQMLEGVVGPRPEIVDIAELVAAAAGEAP